MRWMHRALVKMMRDSANTAQHINLDLTQSYKLDLSMKERPAMNIDGMFLVLYHY